MIVFPHSKINLGLSVIEKRSDGFHNLETVFLPLKLSDALEIVVSKNKHSVFTYSGITIPGENRQNLCLQAYNILSNDFSIPIIDIHLHKRIPIGAGLGGGSSDAAFTLKLLNKIFSLKLNDDILFEYASKIGSDCAFFIQDEPMFASGRGEKLSKINLQLSGYYVLLIKPDININTKEAYSYITPQKPKKRLKEIISQPVNSWKEELQNDFETVIFKKHPIIKNIKQKLYETGAVYASMSGSGSAVFGIFENMPNSSQTKEFKSYFSWMEQL